MFSLSHRIYVSLCWSPVLPDMLINDVLFWCQVCRIFCIFYFKYYPTGGGGWFLMHCTGNKNKKYDLNWKTFLLFMIPFYINNSLRARRCPGEKKFWKQKNSIFLASNTPRQPLSVHKKFQPIRSSRLAGYRQHIWMSCFII